MSINPRSLTLLNRAPYLTVSEFRYAPTALDLSNLVPGGSTADQNAVLSALIDRASAWMDQYCYPTSSGGCLAATTDTDMARVRLHGDWARLVCRYKPVLELVTVQVGSRPSTMVALQAAQLGDVWFDAEKVIHLPVWSLPTTFPGPYITDSGRVYAQWSYVNGYPHTTLAAAVAAGASTITVASTVGMYPGTTLTVYDGADTETVTAASVSGQTVTLTAGLAYAHTPPAAPDAISVSGLPATVKQAAVWAVSAFIKERGDSAIVLADLSTEAHEAGAVEKDAADDLELAEWMLEPFVIATPTR